MGIVLKSFIKIENFLMNVHLVFNFRIKSIKLFQVRFLSIEQNIADLNESAFLNKLLNSIASIIQVPIRCRVWNGWHATPSDRVPWIIKEHISFRVQLLDVYHFQAVCSFQDRQLNCLVISKVDFYLLRSLWYHRSYWYWFLQFHFLIH